MNEGFSGTRVGFEAKCNVYFLFPGNMPLKRPVSLTVPM